MITKTYKIFSLCNDFQQDGMYEELSKEQGCDVYITYRAMTVETNLKLGGIDNVSNYLIELGADDLEEVLIHIDY